MPIQNAQVKIDTLIVRALWDRYRLPFQICCQQTDNFFASNVTLYLRIISSHT